MIFTFLLYPTYTYQVNRGQVVEEKLLLFPG